MNKALLPYPAGRILTFLGVTKNHIPFCPEEKKKSQRCIINHANCLLQHCQENDHSYISHQYSWHLSKSSGHAYPSAFREVSMCKHPFTIFRVMLKLFITCLSVHPICHIILMYPCLLLVIPLLYCVFRALGIPCFWNCQIQKRQWNPTVGQNSHQEITLLRVFSCLMKNEDGWGSSVYCKFHFNLIFGKWILISNEFHYKLHSISLLGNDSKGLKHNLQGKKTF